MQPFTLIQSGGRQKFLQKNKDKKTKLQTSTKQAQSIIIIQKNIRRFLNIQKNYQTKRFQKMQIQQLAKQTQLIRQKQEQMDLWLLSSYELRKSNSYQILIKFWAKSQTNTTIKNRIIKLTIIQLNNLFQFNFEVTGSICTKIIQSLYKQNTKIQAKDIQIMLQTFKSILKSQQNLSNKCIIHDLKCKLFQKLLFQKQAFNIIVEQFSHFFQYFLEFLVTQYVKQNENMQLVCKIIVIYFPQINKNITVFQGKRKQPLLQGIYLQRLCDFYNKLYNFNQDQIISLSSFEFLTIQCLMNHITKLMKNSVKSTIIQKYHIDRSIFTNQIEFQQYLQEKDQWIYLRENLVSSKKCKKQFLVKFINCLTEKTNIISQNLYIQTLVRNQAMKYAFQLIRSFGFFMQLIPMSQAIDYLIELTNEQSIYQIGKQVSHFSKSNSMNSQNLFIMVLSLTQKSAQQTSDLQFIQLYHEQKQKQKLKRVIKDYLLKILKHSMFIPHRSRETQRIIKLTTLLLQNLYNKIFRTKLLPCQIFQNNSFIQKFKNYDFKSQSQISCFLIQFPYVFSLKLRVHKFKDLLRNQKYQHQYAWDDQVYQDYMGMVEITRGHEFYSAFQQIRNKNLRKPFQVMFLNQFGMKEPGVDAGGLKKEFLNRVLKDALSPAFGLFVQNSAHQLLPHPKKSQLKQGVQTQHYQFVGKLIGLAILENITLGYKFSGTFLNAIVGKKNSFDDLQKIDPDLYKSLLYIKDMKQDACQLYLTFLYHDQMRKKHINLLPNGHLTSVTNENKRLYISLLATYKVNKCLQHQTRYIRKGLTKIIQKEWLFMFNYEELNYLISGQGNIDVKELRSFAKVHGFDKHDLTIKHFWQIVQGFTEQQKSNLLMFVTACPRPSFLGFVQLSPPFTIVKVANTQLLPVSHTCSNIIELPDYQDKQLLRKNLLIAISSNSGFQFA